MTGLWQTSRELPWSVRILLLCAIARAISYFALLPFLPIYMHEVLGLDTAQAGYALGLCLLVGTLASVYGGYLADRFNKVGFMLALDGALTALYLILPAFHAPAVVVVVLLLANTASSTMAVTGNALLAELLPSDLRTKVFSLRYSLQNVGAVTGPFIGAWTIRSDARGPFWLAAGVTGLALVTLASTRRLFTATSPAAAGDGPLRFAHTLEVMRADRRLGLFTLGGILSMVVYAPLLTYLTQYLLVVKSSAVAYHMVSYVSAANAIVVIGLQYLIGSRLRQDNLLLWLSWGIAAFVLGLIAMSLSTELVAWIGAACLFTIGEVVVVPAEYTFIDSIAPRQMRGSYFGVQNLIYFGVALGPILCGVVLDLAAPTVMFYALVATAITSWLFYFLGCRAAGTAVADPVRAVASADPDVEAGTASGG